MSEVFDPEKIDRWKENTKDGPTMIAAEVVLASDYDKLLALYQELRDRPYSTWPQGG